MQLDPKTTKHIRSLQKLTLDGSVRVRMRDSLDAYADLHAIQAKGAPARVSYFNTFSFPFARLGALVLVLLVSGTGAAYAAEGSVPGTPLYTIKVAVVEPVQGALISSTQGQAAWHARLATRRLEEATTLASEHKLDDTKQVYLQTQFEAQVVASNKAADSLTIAGKTDAALDARSDLEARITAHAELLALLSNHLETTSATSTDPSFLGTKKLLAIVERRREEVMASRLALEDSNEGDPSVSVATLARAEVSTRAIAGRAEDADVAPIASRVSAAKASLFEAQDSAPSDRAGAYQKARAAERSSEVASILLKNAKLIRSFATTTQATSTDKTATSTEKSDDDNDRDN